MSEATEKILTEARERISDLDDDIRGYRHTISHIEEHDITPRLEERKQLEATIAIFEGKKKTNRGRPAKKDKTEEIANVLKKTGPLTTVEIAERLGTRPGGVERVLDTSEIFSITGDGTWTLVG
jgi:hypothetical protein